MKNPSLFYKARILYFLFCTFYSVFCIFYFVLIILYFVFSILYLLQGSEGIFKGGYALQGRCLLAALGIDYGCRGAVDKLLV